VKGLAGKRILFIGIGFYDYENSIVARLRQHGALVHAFFDRPEILREGVVAAALRRAGITGLGLIKHHERRILGAAAGSPYDYVLVIKGTDLRLAFLTELRRQHTKAEFILYQWDNLARLRGFEDRIPYFDRVLTFDRQDAAERPALKFRPLFFRDDPAPSGNQSARGGPIDLSFVGSLHSNRLQIVRRAQALADSQGMSIFVYIYTGLFTRLKLALRKNAQDVHATQLAYEAVMAINRRSGAILDLPHADQSGLSIRAIEAVGLGKKLITTARDIVHYDFYSSENIQLIPIDEVMIDPRFIRGPARPVPERVRSRYSLDAWLADVFRLTADAVQS
jgi:hypothetical protein